MAENSPNWAEDINIQIWEAYVENPMMDESKEVHAKAHPNWISEN